jgi:hypothetical protein
MPDPVRRKVLWHYPELVKLEQAAKWWNIRPEAQMKLVAISA